MHGHYIGLTLVLMGYQCWVSGFNGYQVSLGLTSHYWTAGRLLAILSNCSQDLNNYPTLLSLTLYCDYKLDSICCPHPPRFIRSPIYYMIEVKQHSGDSFCEVLWNRNHLFIFRARGSEHSSVRWCIGVLIYHHFNCCEARRLWIYWVQLALCVENIPPNYTGLIMF